MPIHDWTRVDQRLYHSFHQSWTVALCQSLNESLLPCDYFAMLETPRRRRQEDFEVLNLPASGRPNFQELEVPESPPTARLIQSSEAGRASGLVRITVRNREGDVLALIQIVSSAHKTSQYDLRRLVSPVSNLIAQGIHVVLIDPFPPSPRDPKGLHQLVWEQFSEEAFDFPPDKPLTIASYDAGFTRVAYVDFIAVGDPLPSPPVFLESELYVPVPLEVSYEVAWKHFPNALKRLLVG